MRENARIELVGVLAAVLLGATLAGSQQAAAQEPSDLRQIIAQARSEVFPAVIFVKPIVAEYESGEREQQEAFGSGVIISPDGFAVTNWHIVDKAVAIDCVLYDKRQVKAELIGSDRHTDLALLKLPAREGQTDYPHASFAQPAALVEGDFVMALGSPFGFQRSISRGIVSNAQRYIGFTTAYKYNTWIQTDAAIDPDKSGGPLINTQAKIVGINTLGVGGNGAGFSIPASTVQDIVARLERDGRVIRAYTGLRLQALKDFHSNTFVDAEHGVLITGVENDSPAAEAGIRTGDILLTVDGKPLEGTYAEMLPEIWCCLADLPIDEPVPMQVQRGGEEIQVTVTPREKGKLEGDDFDCQRWNMTIKEISKDKTPQLYDLKEEGVYIHGVRRPGNAANSGLAGGDIILKMDNKTVTTVRDLRLIYEQIIKDEQREKKVMFEVLRGGLRKWVVLDYRRDYE